MSIHQITPQDAFKILEENAKAIYLDVRTVSEYVAGHPRAAMNVPVVMPNTTSGQMSPNPEFLPVVEANVAKTACIIVGCMSGMRSQFAVDLMQKAGYQNAINMQGGFGGARDAMGRVVTQGWRDAGLPVESGESALTSYDALLRKSRAQKA
jgi:rhodanese-related sulfurtransferase